MEVETYSEKGEAFVSWKPPKFVDNSDSILVITQNTDPGSFRVGLYNITYRAADEARNTAYCIFQLVVLQKGTSNYSGKKNLSLSYITYDYYYCWLQNSKAVFMLRQSVVLHNIYKTIPQPTNEKILLKRKCILMFNKKFFIVPISKYFGFIEHLFCLR